MSAQLLTLAEASERLRMSERKLRGLVAERRIACVRQGRWIRFEEAAIAGYIAAHRVPMLSVVQSTPMPPDLEHLEELARRHRLG